MGKVVVNLVAELRGEESEKGGLLCDSEFGRRNRRSAIDTPSIMADRLPSTWREGRVAGVLQMDIKPAFPSVGRGRPLHTMMVKGIDGDLIRWTACFLSDRMIEIVIEGNVIDRHPVEAGIPQGSQVSQILFTIYTSGLIQWVEERSPESMASLSWTMSDGWRAGATLVKSSANSKPAPETVSIGWKCGSRNSTSRKSKRLSLLKGEDTNAPCPEAYTNDMCREWLCQS